MLRSINSPPDPRDDHLRQLLDQHTTHADRFSALSQLSDAPSTYSRSFFSPRPLDHEPSSAESPLQSPTTSTFSARSPHERLDDPSTSMLDLDDDPRTSVASRNYDDEQNPGDDDGEEALRRMSYLGPKMRFHSLAPWEMAEDTLEEEDEPDYGSLRPTSKKGFGFSSPRSSNTSRPSGESTRSQAKSKQSFETTSSRISYPRGALYALAQESLSTSSLGTSSAGQKTLRGKFPLNRVRSESPNNSVPLSPASGVRSLNDTPYTNLLPQHDKPHTQTPPSSHRRPTYDSHPYANPDLVFSFADDHQHVSPQHMSPQQGVSRRDSINTVTDSIAHSALSRYETKSTLAPVTSTSSVTSRNRTSSVQGKEISSPIPVLNSAHRVDSNPHVFNEDQPLMLPQPGVLPGWMERGTSQPFALISLEEARAQRMRSATTQPAIIHSPTSTSAASSSIIFPDASYDSDNRGPSVDHSGSGHRARARSISAGAKAKSALHTIVGGAHARSERHESDAGTAGSIPGKTLKHKKSGFMRLFNGGRGDDKVQPPPVPSLSDAYAALNTQAQAVHKAPKMTTHRIPISELPSSLRETSSPSGGNSPTLRPSPIVKLSPSPKRPVPPLSINTQPQGYVNRAPVSAVDASLQTRTVPSSFAPPQPWLNTSIPQSAPANVSEFPSLSLRPVSTIFSAQFGDHIVTQDSRPSLETDVGTPGSSTNVFSPVTPGSTTRSERSSSENKPVFMTPISEDQSSVVLQDQILNAKLAWQRQIWELEGQVRDLKAEINDLRKAEHDRSYCESCGRGQPRPDAAGGRDQQAGATQETRSISIVNRPRARTGTSAHFGSAV